MEYLYLHVLVTIFIAVYTARWVYFKILKIAKVKNLVDNPDARKLQKDPVPVMGGIAVFWGLTMGLMVSVAYYSIVGLPIARDLLPVFLVICVMLYVGAIDDILGLTPLVRLLIETLITLCIIYSTHGCIDSLHGFLGIDSFSWDIGVPLTVFCSVGIINAINMIDGVNGLSSGLCILCSFIYGIVFIVAGDVTNACLAFAMMGALLPFFVHNVFGIRSRMFLGDAGTMMMGAMLSWFTISIIRSDSPYHYFDGLGRANMAAFALAALSVPVFDTLRVMTFRMIHGGSPFKPDKTHIHHGFIRVGFSHLFTSFCIVSINLINILVWIIAAFVFHVDVTTQIFVVIVSSISLVWGSYYFLRYFSAQSAVNSRRLAKLGVNPLYGRRRRFRGFSEWLDAPEDGWDLDSFDVKAHLERRFQHAAPKTQEEDEEYKKSGLYGKDEQRE